MQEKALRKEVKTNRGIIVQYQLKKVWIITNYPMFQAVMQLPLSGVNLIVNILLILVNPFTFFS
jgi:hypothetical protein